MIERGCLTKRKRTVQADGKHEGEKENVAENKSLIQRQHDHLRRRVRFPANIILRLPQGEAKRQGGTREPARW